MISSTLLSIAGVVVGGLGGIGLGWLPMPSLARSVVACVLGWMLASSLAAVAWLRSPKGADVLAISVGLPQAAGSALAVAVMAALLHACLGWAGETLNPALATHRGAILGTLGGLIGVVAFGTSLGPAHAVR